VRERRFSELGIAEIDLQERERVDQLLRRSHVLRHVGCRGNERGQGRRMRGARGDETVFDHRGTLLHEGEQQPASRAESVNERGRSESGLAGDVGQGQSQRTDAADRAGGCGEDLGVLDGAWAWRHGLTDTKCPLINRQDY